MPTPTYTPIWSTTLASSASEVVMANIPQTYRDLVLVTEFKQGTSGNAAEWLRFNSDSGGNYYTVFATGTGSVTEYGTNSGTTAMRVSNYGYASTTAAAQIVLSIMDYSATDKHKSVLARANNSAFGVDMAAARWANTSAITTVAVIASSGTFAAGSTFSLFGVAA